MHCMHKVKGKGSALETWVSTIIAININNADGGGNVFLFILFFLGTFFSTRLDPTPPVHPVLPGARHDCAILIA